MDIPTNCCNSTVTNLLLTMGVKKETMFWNLPRKVYEELQEKIDIEYLLHLFDFGTSEEVENCDECKAAFAKYGVPHQGGISNSRRYEWITRKLEKRLI